MAIRARADNLSLDYPEHTGSPASLVDFAEVWAHREVLRQACVRLTGDVARAEDLVQDTFVSALKSGDRLDRRSSIGPWLATVARRRSIDEIRGRQRVAVVATPPEPEPYGSDDPADHVVGQELVQQLRAAVDTLTDRERQLLLRQATYGMSLAELAAEEDTSIASVRSVLARARHKLRITLERNGALGVLPLPRALVSLRDKFNRWAVQFEASLPTLTGATVHVGNAVVAVVVAVATMFGSGPPLGGEAVAMIGHSHDGLAAGVVPGGPSSVRAGAGPSAAGPAQPTPNYQAPPSPVALRSPDTGVPLPTLPKDSNTAVEDAQMQWLSASEDGQYVFAAGLNNGGNRTVFRSADGGATWTRLQADGYRGGRVLVPPTYPHKPTLFVLDELALYRSDDHGTRFVPVAPARGGAIFSPAYAAGDERLLLGGSPVVEYWVSTGMTNPIPGTLGRPPTRTVLAADSFLTDGALLLGATVTTLTATQVGAVYRCTPTACGAPLFLPGTVRYPQLKRLADGTIAAWDGMGMYLSTDEGASFQAINSPVPYGYETIVGLAPGELLLGVSVHTTATGLFHSTDAGASWAGIGFGTPLQRGAFDLVRLSEDKIIAAPIAKTGIRCSLDGGATWAPSC